MPAACPAIDGYGMREGDKGGNTDKRYELNSVDLTAESLAQADVVVLTTNHSAFDIDFMKENARLIVDMRNMIKDAGEKVYKL